MPKGSPLTARALIFAWGKNRKQKSAAETRKTRSFLATEVTEITEKKNEEKTTKGRKSIEPRIYTNQTQMFFVFIREYPCQSVASKKLRVFPDLCGELPRNRQIGVSP